MSDYADEIAAQAVPESTPDNVCPRTITWGEIRETIAAAARQGYALGWGAHG